MGVLENDDRRKHTRVGFATRIEVILDTSGGDQITLEASSKDLSLRGVFVQTDKTFPLKSPCRVNVYLTGGVDDIRLEIQGSVVRQADAGVGILFESMEVETYTHLKNIVLYNSGGRTI